MDNIVENTRQNAIHEKGFDLMDYGTVNEYNKIKVGVKTLEDAIFKLGTLTLPKKPFCDKFEIMKAIVDRDYPKLRLISDYFYSASGIYQTVCNYFAFLYRYDWYLYPENVKENAKVEKVIEEYVKLLSFCDNSYLKKLCGDIALNVVVKGCYYGYIVDSPKGLMIQELPPNFCRSRYSVLGIPTVEFNMAFFDTCFHDINYRTKVLKMFPEEFAKGYVLYK